MSLALTNVCLRRKADIGPDQRLKSVACHYPLAVRS
jgi:hypothetical protein